ncbi:hypothetical protein E2C01_043721 [Portunus trituberculatus]|uniref:Uncharacterized protein n=1 Tax=Portunus trituberculatus TaxID=210409 RepID=A0A5B7FWF9_PORTR|nr:hypothetical protein [Portunus trituberculatus]
MGTRSLRSDLLGLSAICLPQQHQNSSRGSMVVVVVVVSPVTISSAGDGRTGAALTPITATAAKVISSRPPMATQPDLMLYLQQTSRYQYK